MPEVEPLTAEEIILIRTMLARRKKVIAAICTGIGLAIAASVIGNL